MGIDATSVRSVSYQKLTDRYDSLLMGMEKLKRADAKRCAMEIAGMVLGLIGLSACAVLLLGVCLSGVEALVLLGCILSAVVLTVAISSICFRRCEIKLERAWRSCSLRFADFAFSLKSLFKPGTTLILP